MLKHILFFREDAYNLERVNRICEANNISKSDLFRSALAAYLDKIEKLESNEHKAS